MDTYLYLGSIRVFVQLKREKDVDLEVTCKHHVPSPSLRPFLAPSAANSSEASYASTPENK